MLGHLQTRQRRRSGTGRGEIIPVDFAANAKSLGAAALRAVTHEDLTEAVKAAPSQPRTTVIVVEVDPNECIPGYESWWDVPVSEVSEMGTVRPAHAAYAAAKKKERYFL